MSLHDISTKLTKYGACDHSVDCFKDYLSNHQQSVMILGAKSTSLNVCCGVPQGSIMRRLLFITYINNLQDYLTEGNVSLYADNTHYTLHLHLKYYAQFDFTVFHLIAISLIEFSISLSFQYIYHYCMLSSN